LGYSIVQKSFDLGCRSQGCWFDHLGCVGNRL